MDGGRMASLLAAYAIAADRERRHHAGVERSVHPVSVLPSGEREREEGGARSEEGRHLCL
jgi:hypothetical protein